MALGCAILSRHSVSFLVVKHYVIDAQFWCCGNPASEHGAFHEALLVCALTFSHLADTQIGLFEGERDLYELIMIRRGAIRVTGALTPPPHGHCVEEE